MNGVIDVFPSRKRINLLNFQESDLNIRDIAHSLSRLCRYNGHVRGFYSVARHSIRVSQLCSKEFKLAGLLHDAAEAYIGDMVGPLKNMHFMGGYRDIEKKIEQCIDRRYGVSLTSPEVHDCDMQAFMEEQKILELRTHLVPYDPEMDEMNFLHVFEQLKGV